MTEAIIERLHHHIRQNIGAADSVKDLSQGLCLHDDLGAKPLDMIQLVMDVEDEWEGVVYIDDDEAENIRTVGDLERIVLAKVRAAEEQAA